MSLSLHATSGPPPQKAAAVRPEIIRRTANYHPCVWEDYFLAYNTPDHATPDKDTVQKMEVLKEEVKSMLLEAANQPQQQLKLIDDIQRLGVAYHFEVEIDTALKRMNDMYQELCETKNKDDLGIVSLCFRLLRQHGYNVSSGVFNKYKDESNGTFNECLSKDVEGLLSLYEATYLRVHGEDILEEAFAFATSHLKSLETNQLNSFLAAQVLHALKLPLWKTLNRIEARHYISVYQDKDSHSNSLLHFAKLDFNILQKLHQRELGEITSWWRNFNFKEIYPFARDRSIECYVFWGIAMSFEPQYQLARRILTKAVCLMVILDDMYDVYGTVEELTVFTDAMQRLDVSALDELPEYMRHIYRAVLQYYVELEDELSKAGIPLSHAQYAKNAMKEIHRSYLFEAKCVNKLLAPTLEEYMPHSLVATILPLLFTHFFVGMGNMVTTEVFKWLSTHPLFVRAACLICRLIDDMVEHDQAGKAEDTAYLVDYYMKTQGLSKEDTFAEFERQKVKAYKDMNMEYLHPPPSVPLSLPLNSVLLSIPRSVFVHYEYQGLDGFTSSDTKTKELVSSVIIHPIPI